MTKLGTKLENQTDSQSANGGHPIRHALIFVVVLLVVLAVVLAAAYQDGTGFDSLRRYITYGDATEKSDATSYVFDADNSNQFATLGNRLAVLSDTTLQVLEEDGTVSFSQSVKMTSPALKSGGSKVVAYDVGGTQLFVVGKNGQELALMQDEEERLISASLNENGWLSVTTEKKNYKGSVAVYNPEMELAFEFHSSDRFVMDGVVSADGKSLAAVTLGQEDGTFMSNVVLYYLNETVPYGRFSVQDGLVLRMGTIMGKYVAVSDNSLVISNRDGSIEGCYSYGDQFLRGYDLSEEGFATLLLNRYRSGNVGRLVTVGTNGKEIASLDVNEEVLHISVAGRYVSVLYTDELVIYSRDLQVIATLCGTNYAKGCLVRKDGSALVISADHANLFLP